MRTGEQKTWLRKGVLFALITASVTVVLMVLIAGATSEVAFREGSLTASANQTMWNTFASFSGESIESLLIPVAVVALLIIAFLIMRTVACCGAGGM